MNPLLVKMVFGAGKHWLKVVGKKAEDSVLARLNAFVASIQSELRSVPIFLCGFGMGGCAVAYAITAEHHEIEGVIFAASGLVVSKKLSKFKILMSWLLGGLLPKWPISLLPPNQMSSVVAEQQHYDEDPLVYHSYMNAGTAKELLLANLHIGQRLTSIDVPMLVLHGAEDGLVSPEGATAYIRKRPVWTKPYISTLISCTMFFMKIIVWKSLNTYAHG